MKVRLDRLLVERGLVETRNRARQAILEGKVRVGGEVQLRPGHQVDPEMSVELIGPAIPYVSRGALKLEAALQEFAIDCEGRVALDVGASTGGFTQVLLSQGARMVYAVDVGSKQLHPSLREDPRVISLEKTDIRNLDLLRYGPEPSLAVVDVSFISLRLVLPALLTRVASGADVIALIKPQFEVGPQGVGKGGIVREPGLREEARNAVLREAESLGYKVVGVTTSPLLGGDGNEEYLVHLLAPIESGDVVELLLSND